MKKIIVVFLFVSLMLFSACSNKVNENDSFALEKETSSSSSEETNVAEGTIEEKNSDNLTLEENTSTSEEKNKIPFEENWPATFFVDGDINSSSIVGKARTLGLLEYSWSSVDELNVEDLLSEFGQMAFDEYEQEDYRAQYRDYENPRNKDENEEGKSFEPIHEIYQIPQEDYEGYICKYIDISVEKLRSVPEYDLSAETYECLLVIHEGLGGGWPYEYETEQVSDDIYKISMIDASASPNPTLDFIITVENNNNVPKYLSVEKVV